MHRGQEGLSSGTRSHVPGKGSFAGGELTGAGPGPQRCGASLVTALGNSPALGFSLKRKLVPESRSIKTGFKSYVVPLLGLQMLIYFVQLCLMFYLVKTLLCIYKILKIGNGKLYCWDLY